MKTNILINFISAKSAGGKFIFENFYKEILSNRSKYDAFNFYFILPKKLKIKKIRNISIIYIPFFSSSFLIPISSIVILPIILSLKKCTKVINFADIPIKTKIHQVFYFDFAHLILDDKSLFFKGGLNDKLTLFFKKFFFELLIGNVNEFYVQSKYMANKFRSKYQDFSPTILSTPIKDVLHLKNIKNKDKNKPFLICLCKYYPHKNLEILVPLSKLIKKRNLDLRILITVDKNETYQSNKFLNSIEKNNLSDVLINIGFQSFDNAYSILKESEGLLLPTLSESYCIPYIEAFSLNKTILTSDRDFARSVCGNAAYYFDPLNEYSIFSKIEEMLKDKKTKQKKILIGRKIYKSIPSWDIFIKNLIT